MLIVVPEPHPRVSDTSTGTQPAAPPRTDTRSARECARHKMEGTNGGRGGPRAANWRSWTPASRIGWRREVKGRSFGPTLASELLGPAERRADRVRSVAEADAASRLIEEPHKRAQEPNGVSIWRRRVHR